MIEINFGINAEKAALEWISPNYYIKLHSRLKGNMLYARYEDQLVTLLRERRSLLGETQNKQMHSVRRLQYFSMLKHVVHVVTIGLYRIEFIWLYIDIFKTWIVSALIFYIIHGTFNH